MQHKTDEQLANELRAATYQFNPCERWRHRKTGGVYEVQTLALEEATLTPVVVYRQAGRPFLRFTRPVAEFLDGRFELVID